MRENAHLRLFSVLIALSLLVTGVMLAGAAPPAPSEVKLTAVQQTPVGVVGENQQADRWSYIIRLEGAPLATYDGGVGQLAPTSPQALGMAKLDVDSAASRAYMSYLERQQAQALNNIERIVGRRVDVVHSYKVTLNGFSTILAAAEAEQVAKLPGVAAVQRDELRQPLTDVSVQWIGADTIWNGTAQGVEQGTRGEGVIVSVIDTGVWPEHPSFADDGTYPEPPEDWGGECMEPADDTEPPVCNNKLIAVEYYLDTYDEVVGWDGAFFSGRDDNGHGTHTLSTAAGNEGVSAMLLGIDRGTVSGVAPRAWVASYKTCGPQGCYTSDGVAATEAAVMDGVDVINHSIGGGAQDPWDDAGALAFLNALEAGVFVTNSAGNSGPDPDTVGSPANAPWLIAVAASTTNRSFISEITLDGPGDTPADLWGISVTEGVEGYNLVNAEGVPDVEGDDSGLCLNPYPEGTFEPTDAVLCTRGQVARVLRGDNVAAGGAGAVVLRNPSLNSLNTDNYVIPAVHVDHEVGDAIATYVNDHPGQVTITFTAGVATFADEDPRVVADLTTAFSSRGPNGPVPEVIKPDLTAPGVQIMAGNSPQCYDPVDQACGRPGELFQAIAGTSMSSPHAAGAAGLLKAVHPDWTPDMIRSAMMTNAHIESLWKEDGETPADVFDVGAGRLALETATDPGLVFKESADNYMDGADDPASLNLPSFGFGEIAGVGVISREVTSLVGAETTWTVSVDAPENVDITLSPDPITVPANGTASFQVSVDATEADEGWHFGRVTLTHGPHSATMPVAFNNVPAVWSNVGSIMTQWDASRALFTLESGVNEDPFVIGAYGLVEPTEVVGGPLEQDPDQEAETDFLGEGFETFEFTATEDTLWLLAQTTESEVADLDVYLAYDANSDGEFTFDEVIDSSTSPDAQEEVSVQMPEPGDYVVGVQAWAGEGAYTFRSVVLTTGDASDSLILQDAPDSISAAETYEMQLAWDADIDAGDEYFGLVTMGNADDPTAVGFAPVRITGIVEAVQKSVSPAEIQTEETADYEIVLTNAGAEAMEYNLADDVPDDVAVVPDSVTGGATVDANGDVTWSGTVPGATEAVVIGPSETQGFGYVSLASLGIGPIETDFTALDDAAVNFDGDPVSYLGNEYELICMVTNGYLVMGGCESADDIVTTAQQFPDATVPNNVIAPWMTDLDLDGGDGVGAGTWYAAALTDGTSNWRVFEWEGAQRWNEEGTAFTFQVWLKVENEEVTLTYALLDGPTSNTGVGAENASGTVGETVYYNDGEGTEVGTVPTVDDILDVSGGLQPSIHTITYSAEGVGAGEAINVATVTSGPSRDEGSATTTILAPPPPGRTTLVTRAYVDYRCNTYFSSGIDIPLAGVPVTVEWSNGATREKMTAHNGMALFNAIGVPDQATVSVEAPTTYNGWQLALCPDSPSSITVDAGDFGSFASRSIFFRFQVVGESPGP